MVPKAGDWMRVWRGLVGIGGRLCLGCKGLEGVGVLFRREGAGAGMSKRDRLDCEGYYMESRK